MAKVKAHIRVAKNGHRYAVSATTKPSTRPLTNTNGADLPTVSFALVLNIDDEEFKKAEKVLAEVDVPSGKTRIVVDVHDG